MNPSFKPTMGMRKSNKLAFATGLYLAQHLGTAYVWYQTLNVFKRDSASAQLKSRQTPPKCTTIVSTVVLTKPEAQTIVATIVLQQLFCKALSSTHVLQQLFYATLIPKQVVATTTLVQGQQNNCCNKCLSTTGRIKQLRQQFLQQVAGNILDRKKTTNIPNMIHHASLPV